MLLKEYKNFYEGPVIYGIYNQESDKWYIGSCANFRLRIRRHYYYLRLNQHHSSKLQRSWNKYGEDCFQVIILEECSSIPEKELGYIEIKYIRKYNSVDNGYNMVEIYHACTNDRHLTSEQIDKFRKTRMLPVTAIDRKTNIVLGRFDSVSDAASAFNIQSTNVSRCCKGTLNYMKGAVFVYTKDYDPNKDYRTEGHGKGVPKSPEHKEKMKLNKFCKVLYKYDLNYNLLATYQSRSEAERQEGFKREWLRIRLNKNLDGFIYSHEKYEKDIV